MEAGDAAPFTLALERGALLADRYRIADLLTDSSSFALTYLATDTAAADDKHASVAIKEFLPRIYVGRAGDGQTVKAHSPAADREFARGLRRFLHEATILADVASPNLIRVLGYFEANGTAYLVSELHHGTPLPAALAAAGGRISARAAVALVLEILDPLERLHTDGVLHRAISPDAIDVTADWQPILHGFSTRRHVPGQALDLAPGFAALEQYASRDIGSWTDVYACAALLHYLVTGSAPPPAVDRAAGKSLIPGHGIETDLPPGLSFLIARGMSLLPEQRPHGVAEFRRQLDGLSIGAVSLAPPMPAPAPKLHELEVGEIEDVVADEPIALQLAAGGRLVVPRHDDSGPGFRAKLTQLAGRARERLRRSKPEAQAATVAAENSTSKARVSWRERLRLGAEGGGKQRWETAVGNTGGEHRWERPGRYTAAALLTLVVLTSTYGLVAGRRSPPPVATVAAPPAPKTAANPAAPIIKSAAAPSRTKNAAVLQGAVGDAERSRPRSSQSAPTPAGAKTPPPVAATSRSVPSDLLLDLETRLGSGKEEIDLGLYALARRILRSAMTVADGAMREYSRADTLRAIRAELDLADRRALRACQSDNEFRRKRGEATVPCE